MPVWPSSLPQKFSADSYARGHPDNLLVTRNDVGPAKMRRRSSRAVAPLSGSMVMTRAQMDTLRVFIDAELSGGVTPFSFPDQECGDVHDVRFTAMPEISRINNSWFRVTIELEILP